MRIHEHVIQHLLEESFDFPTCSELSVEMDANCIEYETCVECLGYNIKSIMEG